MTALVFVDTNVFVYRRDLSEPDKQEHAQRWLEQIWLSRCGRTSFQVLQEYYVTVTRKLEKPLAKNEARQDVEDLLSWKPQKTDAPVLRNAWSLQDRYSLSWWDALVVAAARATDCRYLLSEDLQPSQDFDGVTVVNPFATPVDTLFPS